MSTMKMNGKQKSTLFHRLNAGTLFDLYIISKALFSGVGQESNYLVGQNLWLVLRNECIGIRNPLRPRIGEQLGQFGGMFGWEYAVLLCPCNEHRLVEIGERLCGIQ